MCGIAGRVNFTNQEVKLSELQKMSKTIWYRGPDDEGFYINKERNVGLANRRLAIIDLSQKGHQPMSYMNRYFITFNGEVYNFQTEKKELEKDGYTFTSNTDTEVILALYDKYGINCLNHLRGMFAFALYDEMENKLFLARDRLGVKPLKYFYNGSVLIFASELKAILTQEEAARNPDYGAIQMYLSFGYVPSPLTGFNNIKKLEPGHFLTINLKTKTITKRRYWEPIYGYKLDLSEKEWCLKILETLEGATKLRMIADVEIGAFLSGGVDSSGVVATMARLTKKQIKTFTVIFKDQKLSEALYAKKIANKYKTDHHELLIEPQSIEILPQLAYQYEEPFSDASSIVTYLISKLAKRYVTVILNGDGGDENFAGYPNRYFRLKRDVNFNQWIIHLRPLAVSALRSFGKISKSKVIQRGTKFLEKSKLPLFRRFASYNQVFGLEEIASLTKGELANLDYSEKIFDPVKKCFELFKGKDLKDAGLKFDLLYYLPDDLLAKVDIASMAVSLEARSPFLDYKMVELACKIPFNLKVKNGISKYILKKALEKIVPKDNLYRPKMGFTIPLNKWFRGNLRKYTQSILINKKAKTHDIFNQEFIKNLLKSHSENTDYGPQLWSLLTLELWFRNYF